MYPIWDSSRPELTWTHYRTLMRVEEQHIREFYMEEAIKGNWSVRQTVVYIMRIKLWRNKIWF